MKVILLQDVAKIGKRFSVVDVPSGYALNKLIPKRLAEPATPVNMKRIERRQAETSASTEADTEKFNVAKTALTAKTLEVKAEANDKGHLFKAVHEADIVAVAEAADIKITAEMLSIASPIKEVGEHQVTLTLGSESTDFTIAVAAN